MVPEDPRGYSIEYTDDGVSVTRVSDDTVIGVFPNRIEAVAAAEADIGGSRNET